MNRHRWALLLAFAFVLLPNPGQAGPKPLDPSLLCKYRCDNDACVSDIFTRPESYCIITFGPVSCTGGTDPENCRPSGGG